MAGTRRRQRRGYVKRGFRDGAMRHEALRDNGRQLGDGAATARPRPGNGEGM